MGNKCVWGATNAILSKFMIFWDNIFWDINNNSMILTSVLQNQKLITKQLVKPLHKYVLGGYWRTKNACYRLCALN